MYHSINFELISERGNEHKKFNTYEHFGLVPTVLPVIPPPSVKTHTIEIPGTNGTVDLTSSLTPYILYQNRSGSFDFVLVSEWYDWPTVYSKLMNYLHGHKAKIILEDDPNWYYEGRFAINSWNPGQAMNPTVSIDYDLYPYKVSVMTAQEMDVEPWKWDPFSFYDGIITDLVSKNYSGTGLFTNIRVSSSYWKEIGVLQPDSYDGYGFDNRFTGWMPVIPEVYFSSSGMGIKIVNDQLGYTYEKDDLQSGTFTDPELIFYDWFGGYEVYLKGSGTVSFDFRKGSL